MTKKITAGIVTLGFSTLPFAAFAVSTTYSGSNGLVGLLTWFSGILGLIVPILIALAVVWFIWSVFQFIVTSDEEKKKKAKGDIIWGIVAIFIMVSVWGLVGILSSTFQLNNGFVTPVVPTVSGAGQ